MSMDIGQLEENANGGTEDVQNLWLCAGQQQGAERTLTQKELTGFVEEVTLVLKDEFFDEHLTGYEA